MIGALGTSYIHTSGSDPLQLHDVLRITFTAPKLFLAGDDDESELLSIGLDRILDDQLTLLVPASRNPYTPGALSATIDFLYPRSTPATVADAVNDLLAAAAPAGFESLAPFDVRTVQKIIGAHAAVPGTRAAGAAAFGDDASSGRAASDATGLEQRDRDADPLEKIGAGLLTAGKVIAGVAIAGGIVYVVAQVAPLLNTAKRATS